MPDESGGRGTITIIGAGSWGTALSGALGQAGWRVKLWSRRAEIAEAIRRGRRNPDYLPEFALPPSVEGTTDLGEAVADAAMVVLAVPSQGVGETCERLRPHLPADGGIVSAAKGLEHETGRRLSVVIGERLGEGAGRPIAVLSGPNLASEVAAGVATASVAACADAAFASAVQAALSTPRFRVYTNSDVLGVELGGALKNIIAIGAGISDGLGFGDNTKAALLTRGLAEITRLGVALGARGETFRGLSGMGDMVATCASSKSGGSGDRPRRPPTGGGDAGPDAHCRGRACGSVRGDGASGGGEVADDARLAGRTRTGGRRRRAAGAPLKSR